MQVVCSPPKWILNVDIPEAQYQIEFEAALKILKSSDINVNDEEELCKIATNKVMKEFEEYVFVSQEWKTFPYLLGQIPEFKEWLVESNKLKATTRVEAGLTLFSKITVCLRFP